MKFIIVCRHFFLFCILITVVFMFSTGCKKASGDISSAVPADDPASLNTSKESPQLLKNFVQTNLVANNASYGASLVDANLVNGWGISFSSGGTPWVSAAFSGTSPVYTQAGAIARPAVAIPSPVAATGGLPTGQVFNGGTGFLLSNGQPARFMFVGLDGVLSGWNGAAGNFAIRVTHNAGSVYTGMAIATNGGSSYIYASDFSNRKIDVWNQSFSAVNMSFTDPGLPDGYSPFNIQAIDNKLYVMYAKVGPDGRDEKGPGNGYVSVFNADGSFVNRFISRGQLDAPWGVAKAPANFWGDGSNNPENVILVGNFGDGRINAYYEDGRFYGQLRFSGQPIIIDGLWGISFAPATTANPAPNKLFFAAGPNLELDGLFGYISK